MQFSPQTPDRSECRVCRARLQPGSAFCPHCGAQVDQMPEEELRGVIYLLSELARWEAQAEIGSHQAARLRQRYERRREELRAAIESNGGKAPESAPVSTEATPHKVTTEPAAPTSATEAAPPDYPVAAAFSQFLSTSPPRPQYQPPPGAQRRVPFEPTPRRTLIETLSDPYIIRLLSFIGASMLVVGVVIWLKDILYLKLREPVVQASLLALGTLAVTFTGWYLILRTRQKLTGRALTLIGSVLVPVNFWFLVRSGLVANNGRAWVVCALCAMLYAHTAALLRERLYVYLASIASIFTAWALVYRTTPEAFGLYALTLSGASFVFLHLSRLFPTTSRTPEDADESAALSEDERSRMEAATSSRLSYDLWGTPLVRVALAGCALSALFYMPLRLWPSPSLYDGIFRLRASDYDASIGMLLYAVAAYICWFTGRYIYTDRRVLLYTLSTLALLWTLLLALDGFRLSGLVHLFALSASALAVSAVARLTRDEEGARAFHLAGVITSLALAFASFSFMLADGIDRLTGSAALACLAFSFALLSTPRLSDRFAQVMLAHAAAIFASLAFLTALAIASPQSETLFVAACAAWPFALYALAQFAKYRAGEAQLAAPFVRIADAEFVILFLYASLVALLLHGQAATSSRPMFCALVGAVLFGVLRSQRERSGFGAALATLAALVMTAAALDALRMAGLWPGAWPIAAGVICAAFLLRNFAPALLNGKDEGSVRSGSTLGRVVQFVTDSAVIVCAPMWFAEAVVDGRGIGAGVVLLLALLYWFERAARSRRLSHAHLVIAHAVALFITLLIALRVDGQWFAVFLALILFPIFFAVEKSARGTDWIAFPANTAAAVTLALAYAFALVHASPHLQASDPLLLAPCVSVGAIALASFGASLLSTAHARVHYFRAGLAATVLAFILACLRAGFDPVSDIEIYSSPLAVVLLAIAYLSARRSWAEYDLDTDILLWLGSLLLALPLLFHALYFRLLLDVPAPWRDISTLCAALALVLFSLFGRLRAPLLVGLFTLALELAALTLTSVNWLQVPVKYYLISIGALIVIIVWAFEYRHEQILLARQRFNQHREYALERFGEWR